MKATNPVGASPRNSARRRRPVTTATLELQPMRDAQPTDRGASATRRDRVVSLVTIATPCSKPIRVLSVPLSARRPNADREAWSADLTGAEARVLRYLPTHLTVQEIACELCLSANTVKTHVRHIYEKLDAHGRREAVARARSLRLLTPSSCRPTRRRPIAL